MVHQPIPLVDSPAGPRSTPVLESRRCSSAHDPAATLIRISEVVAIVGLARPTIYKLLRQPDSNFPQPVKLSDSTARGAPVAWVLAEVQAWVKARIAARGRGVA
ncbi:AlpA family phage regulatory protein [Pseudomonas sp. KB-10]|uniref:helix-turn-helix transcriptional regulator n=1 Tax=Pseudomonas sp. KB-10 TaxID=2292264 RepID=UPI001BAE8ECC|nr:AlpA family phage regulatory protein [Pseudomonas sp. KB-10]